MVDHIEQDCQSNAVWYIQTAKAICESKGWPFLLPVTVRKKWFSGELEIRTNADSMGCNVIIRLNKDRKVLSSSFLPR